jgi:hypothetical protein
MKTALCAFLAASLFLSGCGPWLQLAQPQGAPPPSSSPSEDPSNELGSSEPGSSGSSFNEPSPSGSGSSGSRSSGSSFGSNSAPREAPKEPPISSVSVEVKNECSEKVEYCVESGSSTLNTSLGGNTTTSHTMRPGDKIRLKKGSNCAMTIFTAPASRDRQKVMLCER